jgi:hypothetical protein
LFGASLTAQTPFVKIVSPPKGTVVHPGDRVTVTADATPSAFRMVYLMPFVTEASPSGPPYRFVFQVPSHGASGDLYVAAVGVPEQGYDPVTAVGHGSAKITVKNGKATVVVPVTVPKGD